MKHQSRKIFSLLVLTLALVESSLSASPQTLLTANIPFDFAAGNKTFRAGVYMVGQISMQSVLSIRSADRSDAAIFLTQNSQEKWGPAKLVFKRYRTRYFLAQVCDGVNERDLPKSRLEREAARNAAKELAQKSVEPEIVYIAAQ
ncbi:MAG: hypothetical protein L0220_21825 [Acidobacteria bacterium]|nr:hypothetical protein [Acidobacteriota bacterium]